MVKCLSTMRETWVQSLGQEDPLEKEMAIHSSTIVWKISWTEEPGRLESMGSQRVRHDWAISLSLSLMEALYIGTNSDWNWRKWRKPLTILVWPKLNPLFDLEVRNRFKGLDLIECLMNYGRRFMTLYKRQESRPSPRKRNAKKQNGCLRRPYK